MCIVKIVNRIIILSAFVVAIGCNNETSTIGVEEQLSDETSRVGLTDVQLKTAGVELGRIEEKQISGTIKANGVLDVPPQQLVSISAPLGGFVKSTVLLQGSRVRKGELIATIENIDFIQIQQDYLEAKSNLEFSKTDYERQQQLATENVNSAKTLQQSKANYSNWNAKYSGLLEKLRVLNVNVASVEQGKLTGTINLYSPINGYVTEVNVNIGKFANPTDVLFEIVDTEHLHAELIIFEKDVPKLKIGQKVRFTLANETKGRMATVYLIGREIKPDRTIQVHCHIDQEDSELLPGMYLYGMVETGGALVAALPDEAVIDFQGTKHLFIKAEDKQPAEGGEKVKETYFEMVEIQVGDSELGYTEVIVPPHFKKDAQVVVKGAYAILSKLKNTEEGEEPGH
jgi:cobalt-zinc-cadmium efflux system membrane fusion protein